MGDNTMANIDVKLAAWKNKLLDLGKRNKLINYKDTKRSSLRITTPQIYELWSDFVINEKPLEFPYVDEDQMNLAEVLENETLYSVVTNQPIKEQQKTLRSLREKSKTATEELGVNILYLSFGFLKWTETSNSDQTLISPLVLVPVTLSIGSISDPYILSLHEDEIVINPTLKYKLENDFGIILPELDEELDLPKYLNSIRNQTSNNKWEVLGDVGLSLLSFLKINMYRDLEKNKEKIILNPVVRALSGDTTALNYGANDLSDFDHDHKTKPIDVFQVVDADSSQQDAIVYAKKGVSFVLQGPPGTGKSQTITNIIAESIADGKKVLFVSEKMAALDVVHRRLANVGLTDFCLTLHSHKAHKREILDQLGSVLSLSHKKANISEEAFQKLDLLQLNKEKLNEYSDSLFEKVLPLEKTIYEVNGILANLHGYEELIFSIPDVAITTPKKYNSYINTLNQFIQTVGKMSDDYKINPWNGANVLTVSNELRHDIGANVNKLIPKITETSKFYESIQSSLGLELHPTYNNLFAVKEILITSSQSPKVPIHWIVGEDITPLFSEIEEFSKLKIKFESIKTEIGTNYYQVLNYDKNAPEENFHDVFTSIQCNNALNDLSRYIDDNYCFKFWNNNLEIEKIQLIFNEFKFKVNEINILKSELLNTFEKEVLEIDSKAILLRFKTEYTSFFKYFKKQYKSDKKEILGKYKDFVKKVEDSTVISVLTKLRQIGEISDWIHQNSDNLLQYFGEKFKSENTDIEDLEKTLSTFRTVKTVESQLYELKNMTQSIDDKQLSLKLHYDYFYKGFNTDWTSIAESLKWASDFRKLSNKYSLNRIFIDNICSDDEKINFCVLFITELEALTRAINVEFPWFLNMFVDQESFKSVELSSLNGRLRKCVDGLAMLEEWIDFRNVRQDCIIEGLDDYIKIIQDINLETQLIIPIFKKRFFRLWLDAIMPNYPAVMNFRRRSHDSLVKEFGTLDKLQLDIAKARIQKKLIDNLPSLERFTSGVDEISVLKRELSKQRRIMPIRKLFTQIPNLLLTLKPCLMMSPLSVSIFLESDSYEFDLVIFDEASQINTENAIGAISRAKQVIIAGDSKQLPPTNFFTATTSDGDYDSDDDEYDDVNAYESILDEAMMLPERTLLWHYRSRHEHLIAFSNAKIYKNNLITFPSSVDKVSDNGVEYVYVKDGTYDRGGKKGNINEAQKITELVFDHFKRFPNRSLGVIAFGEVQQQAIDTAIRHMRINNQSFERFFKEDIEESFFVKNLENVQGDERDTIIFSIGYAKAPQGGQMHMNFGPLSRTGGERRLNVAITRAKHNVKLVGSIMPTDIDLDRVTTDGPKLLRTYIDYAIHGPSVLLKEITQSDVIEHDSPFEAAVFNVLDKRGYKLGTQVGCSGYRIDMAVKHPNISGKYVIGIECDGASYHSARTARERDRLRQAVLEDMGWKIYRVWSTDWIKDPVTESEKLIIEIEKALSEYVEETIDGTQNFEVEELENSIDDFLTIDIKEISKELTENPYGFTSIEPTNFDNILVDVDGYVDLGDCIKAVVDNEFPVHYELLCKRVAYLFGNEKATIKVRTEVDLELEIIKKSVIRKGDFLFPTTNKLVTAKHNNSRPINHISTEELAEAIYRVANVCVGATRDSIFLETARAYGFKRTGDKINAALSLAFKYLLVNKRVKEVDGKVIVI